MDLACDFNESNHLEPEGFFFFLVDDQSIIYKLVDPAKKEATTSRFSRIYKQPYQKKKEYINNMAYALIIDQLLLVRRNRVSLTLH